MSRYNSRAVDRCDAELRKLQEQLHDNTWDPDELANVREDIDDLLEQRAALTGHG